MLAPSVVIAAPAPVPRHTLYCADVKLCMIPDPMAILSVPPLIMDEYGVVPAEHT